MAVNGRQAERTEVAVTRALDAALRLFSRQGYGATSMRQISTESGLSVGNLYHHFGSKELMFQQLIDGYWQRLLDPEDRLQKVFARAAFPEDLEQLAAAIEESVELNSEHIMLIFIDVIEFRGQHIRRFYETMADRFRAAYAESFERRRAAGQLGEVDPLVAVMVATRWLYYFYTVEKCFGVPMHFGMSTHEAVDEFIKILRNGVLPRGAAASNGEEQKGPRRGR